MLIPLELPPGIHSNGTDLESAGRWLNGSLVRWREGILQPIGGWRERTTETLTSPARAALAWQDNDSDRWVAFGGFDALTVSNSTGALFDVTPVGLTSGTENATVNTGFGGGTYGTSFYGTPRPDNGNYSEATTWTLSTWGENLLACSVSDGTIYEWTLSTGTPAAALANAPTNCLGVHVTPERFVFALGAGGNPRQIDWSDREDNTTWTPTATNRAGSFVLQTDGQIMGAALLQSQTLILTDTDAHVANYVGPPFVYGFDSVGQACGVISRKAVVSASGGAFWMGQRGFFRYIGGAAEPISCDVLENVFGNISSSQRSKVFGVHNAQFGEVWWFYPSASALECDSYVTFNYLEGHWTVGKMARTCGVDRGVFASPIWAHPDGTIYDQEVGLNYDGSEVFAESGPLKFGENVFSVNQLIPDERTQGGVEVTLKARYYPNAQEAEHGPFSMDAPTDVRVTGRQMRVRVVGKSSTSWRWGIPRMNIMERGGR